VHLRRALLLFAIVLGLAAVAASISRPADIAEEPPPPERAQTTPSAPTVGPGRSEGELLVVNFDAGKPRSRLVDVGRAVTVNVEVEAPGQVQLPSLGVSAAAEPHTPARFDILPTTLGRVRIEFLPADGDELQPAGTLVIRPARITG
jgi:hypothetical protein